MDIRIGIVQSMKELEVELPEDAERDKVMKEVETALGSDSVLWLTDRKGRRVGVPASRIAYVEFAQPRGRARRRLRHGVIREADRAVIDYHLHLWPHSESSVWFKLDQIAAYCDEAAASEGVTELALTEHAHRFVDVMSAVGPLLAAVRARAHQPG